MPTLGSSSSPGSPQPWEQLGWGARTPQAPIQALLGFTETPGTKASTHMS